MVIGGNAVAAWVVRVDAEAVRNTKDGDLLVRRDDFDRVVTAIFVHQKIADIDLLLDAPDGAVRSALHVIFAVERVRNC